MKHHHFLVLALLRVLHVHPVVCEQYCIQSTSTEDGVLNSSCRSLNQFASSNYSGSSSIILTFLPGRHCLDVELLIFNTREFRLLGSENSSVMCTNLGKFTVRNVSNVSISNLSFYGCGEKITFYNTDYNHAALMLSGITSAEINRSVFMSNRGGAIIAVESTVTISYCTFSDNEGTALSFKSSSVIVSHCNFTNHSESYTLYVTHYSAIKLIDSNFVHNRLPENSTSVNYEAVITVAYSVITMSRCSFQANKATMAGGVIVLNNANVKGNDLVVSDNSAHEGALIIIECIASFSGTIRFSDTRGHY